MTAPRDTPDRAARRHLATNHQVISHAEARAYGLTDDQIRGRLSSGEWERLSRGVYGAGNSADSWLRRARAALIAGPPATVVSHLTTAALLDRGSPPPLPHITVPPTASGRARLAVVHHALVPALDRCTIAGLACTSASRTIVDCAALLRPGALAELVDGALCARLATPQSIVAILRRAGQIRGKRNLLDVLDVWSASIEPGSPAEVRLLRLLHEWGFDRPECQHEVRDADGRFVARLDVAWPGVRIAVEYDGQRTHGARQWAADHERQARAERLGWHFERATKLDLMPGNDQLRRRLDAAFAHARARGAA